MRTVIVASIVGLLLGLGGCGGRPVVEQVGPGAAGARSQGTGGASGDRGGADSGGAGGAAGQRGADASSF